jgi:hypothetical protein
MNTFCTIITKNYYPYTKALFKSLKSFDAQVTLQVLICDGQPGDKSPLESIAGLRIFYPGDLTAIPLVSSVYKKYAHTDLNFFRWSLKPILLTYLLERDYSKVIYVDSDIFFYNDYQFLFKELNNASILLTPHWRSRFPSSDEKAFYSLFTDGMFNAGFIGAGKGSKEALSWWAEACHFKMGSHHEIGIQDDQRYLDFLPVGFEAVKILRHRGLNISGFNQLECRRLLVDGKVLINGEYPVVFIHYNQEYIADLLKGDDKLLFSYFQTFKNCFEEEGILLQTVTPMLTYYLDAGKMLKLKWALRLRTRIKRGLAALLRKL